MSNLALVRQAYPFLTPLKAMADRVHLKAHHWFLPPVYKPTDLHFLLGYLLIGLHT